MLCKALADDDAAAGGHMKPWESIAAVPTAEGVLELRRRGARDYLILIDGRVLMTSVTRRSEEALSRRALADDTTRVLIGGLGMAFTLRAALDAAPRARVTVVELNPIVLDWCRGPLADLTACAVEDPRVVVQVGDVAAAIARARPMSFDAILLDLYEGPHQASQQHDDPFYGPRALARTHEALAPGGVFGVWSEDADPAFARRIAARFDVTMHRIGDGGRRHVVYLGRRR